MTTKDIRSELPWPKPETIYDDDGAVCDVVIDGHEISVRDTGTMGVDSGRSRWLVRCVTCDEVLHRATTSAANAIGMHMSTTTTTKTKETRMKVNKTKRSVMQDWTWALPFMQQSVLIAAVRGPDGIRKDHPVKVLCRWLRRSCMLNAFDGQAHLDPMIAPPHGSFTGALTSKGENGEVAVRDVDHALDLYLRSVDELPHHFQLHFMHAAEVLGYKHENPMVRAWWRSCYLRLVNDAHLFPETVDQMDARLGDEVSGWKDREEVTAR